MRVCFRIKEDEVEECLTRPGAACMSGKQLRSQFRYGRLAAVLIPTFAEIKIVSHEDGTI
jgi:hypothetical protein